MTKSSFNLIVLAAISVIVTAIGITSVVCNMESKEVLHVYTWSDYIDPELVAEFETEHNCKVSIDTFADNESMLAKLMSGASGYDVVFPSSYIVPVMVRNGLVAKLSLDKLPTMFKNIDNKFSKHFHKDMLKYSIPYAFSVTGIAYRKDRVPADKIKYSWDDLKNPILGRRVSLLRDVREMIGIGLRMNGCSVNSLNESELARSLRYIIGLKQYASKLDNEMYRTAIVSGELNACIGYNSDVLQIMYDSDGKNIGFYIPNEGSTCCWDEMVILSKSTKKELSHAFIDFLYDGKRAARNMKYICSAVPNKEMWEYLDAEYKDNELINLNSNVLNKVELIRDISDGIRLYNDLWDIFMSAGTK